MSEGLCQRDCSNDRYSKLYSHALHFSNHHSTLSPKAFFSFTAQIQFSNYFCSLRETVETKSVPLNSFFRWLISHSATTMNLHANVSVCMYLCLYKDMQYSAFYLVTARHSQRSTLPGQVIISITLYITTCERCLYQLEGNGRPGIFYLFLTYLILHIMILLNSFDAHTFIHNCTSQTHTYTLTHTQ